MPQSVFVSFKLLQKALHWWRASKMGLLERYVLRYFSILNSNSPSHETISCAPKNGLVAATYFGGRTHGATCRLVCSWMLFTLSYAGDVLCTGSRLSTRRTNVFFLLVLILMSQVFSLALVAFALLLML